MYLPVIRSRVWRRPAGVRSCPVANTGNTVHNIAVASI